MENDIIEIKNCLSILTTEVISLRQEMRYGFQELHKEIVDGDNKVLETLRSEMKQMLGDANETLRGEIKETEVNLRTEMKDMLEDTKTSLRTEMKDMLEDTKVSLKTEMKDMLEDTKTSLRTEMKEMLDDTKISLKDEFNKRFDQQDIKFEMLQRSVDGLKKEMHQKFKEEKEERTNDINKIVNIKR